MSDTTKRTKNAIHATAETGPILKDLIQSMPASPKRESDPARRENLRKLIEFSQHHIKGGYEQDS